MNGYLAVDIGASSGRHIFGWMENGKLFTEEVYRFQNEMKRENGALVWDMDALFEAWPHAEASSRRGGEEERPAGEGTGGGSEDAPSATAGFSGYAGFGIRGYGFQGRCATFLVDAGRLRLGVSLPWSCAFGDAEDERAALAAAFRVTEVCLGHIPASGILSVFIGPEGFRWRWKDGEAEEEGSSLDSLLDVLEGHGGAAEEAVPSYQWMRV